MILKTPSGRLSISLVLIAVNLLFLAKMIGFIPDDNESELEMRKALSESLALQFSVVAEKGEYPVIQRTLAFVVERNKIIRSAAIRTTEGELLAVTGNHLAHWRPSVEDKSTPTHVYVPLFKKDKHWADVEIRFAPLWEKSFLSGFTTSFTGLLISFSLSCFLVYFLIIKRTLRELDPSAVIPDRVQNAFDVLKEGVLILDDQEHIVMANQAFASVVGKLPKQIVGLKGSELGWLDYHTHEHVRQLPWARVLNDNLNESSASLKLMNSSGSKIKMVVKATMVPNSQGTARGALVTFDDITELEEKNFELENMIEKLQEATEEIQLKNKELVILANHDPLTLCLNRRSLTLKFDDLFARAKQKGKQLSCLMTDIDFFKSVNDTYGHSIGDQVIKAVADALKTTSRNSDLIGRYGGEEFVMVMPDTDLDTAGLVAERIRKTVEQTSCSGINITISMGVSSIESNAGNSGELVDQADKALYAAKESGRNRVVTWGEEFITITKDAAPAMRQGDEPEEETPLEDIPIQDTPNQENLQHRVTELEAQLKKRTMELKHYKLYDASTGLPTQSLFEDRINLEITRSRRLDSMIAVLSVSVDTIKRIHETQGHSTSEQLIKDCGHRLNNVLRQNIDAVSVIKNIDQVAAISLISQTEFGILLTDIKQTDHATWIIKRMLDSFEEPFKINDGDVYISAYMGVSIFPYDGNSADELYSSASNACRFAQSMDQEERYLFASDNLNKEAAKQIQIQGLLHEALPKNEMQVYYQPKISTATGQIDGFEALLRWYNEQMGFIPPDQFIPIAEQSGQINKIGEWVFYTVCRQLRNWIDNNIQVRTVAVNLSGRQLGQKNLPVRLQEIMDEFEIDSRYIEIELTESYFLHPEEKPLETLTRIKDMGIKISIDDFGTGYSSLAYLRDMPVSTLKIDRMFINNIHKDESADKLIAAILSIAHALELEVVAEGVEEKYQVDYLTEMGCEYLQGYYFSRPLPTNEVASLLQKPYKVGVD